MPAPSIVNRRPDEGDVDVSADAPFRFGVRDVDTRADLSTVYAAATYARAVYSPEALPEEDDTLDAAGAEIAFGVFDDATGTADPGDPCDRSIEEVDLVPVYRIANTTGGLQEGFLFVTLPVQDPVGPYSARVRVDPASVTAAATYAYVDPTTYPDFVGVVIGLVYWPESTAVFILLRDDGGTRRVTAVGPATDGTGTRAELGSIDYDWTAETTYSIFLDPGSYRSGLVLVTGADGEETTVAAFDLDALDTLMPSARFGDLLAEDAPSGVTCVVGLDATVADDYIDVYSLQVANYGRVLVTGGSQTGSSSVDVRSSASIPVTGSDGAEEWTSSGEFEEEATSTALRITAAAGPAVRVRDEPDLSGKEWMLVGKFTARNATHPGVYTTGMGFQVEDGSSRFRLLLLDSFAENTLGIEDTTLEEDETLTGYALPADAVDWEEDVSFVFSGSALHGALRLYLGTEDASPAVDTPYDSAGHAASTETAVSFGFVDSGDFAGDFYLVDLRVFTNCTFYEGYEGTAPEAQAGWARASSGGSRAVGVDTMDVDCTEPGTYDIYWIEDTTLADTSGAVVVFKAQVTGWTDAAGAVNPPRSEFGPIAAVSTELGVASAQLRFVVAEDGTAYAFLSNEESDYADVLAQNADGLAISTEIDISSAHAFMLEVCPRQYVRLYVDGSTTPAIEVAWPSSGALRANPTYMPATAAVAFGSLGEDTGVACTFHYARASVGRGYDISATLDVDEDDLQDRVYGSTADLFVDVQDS